MFIKKYVFSNPHDGDFQKRFREFRKISQPIKTIMLGAHYVEQPMNFLGIYIAASLTHKFVCWLLMPVLTPIFCNRGDSVLDGIGMANSRLFQEFFTGYFLGPVYQIFTTLDLLSSRHLNLRDYNKYGSWLIIDKYNYKREEALDSFENFSQKQEILEKIKSTLNDV